MATSPPASPGGIPQRPMSAIARAHPRSSSRLSMTSKTGGGSRASDDESRTAVKVAVRVRPPLKPTDPGYDLIPQRFQRAMVQTTSDTSLAIDSPQGRKLFVFDRVFSSDVQQEGIWNYVSDCIGAFTQGYNVSLLAYGQSGAGKSYTMGTSGPEQQYDQELMGVIPRAAMALFEKLDTPETPKSNAKANRSSLSHLKGPRGGLNQQNSLGDREWSLKATYVEIYNEQLRDLLVPDTTPMNERVNVAIREDTKGNIILTGLRQVEINSVDDLMNALNFGSSIRQTDATAINAKSSRSHAVFSLNLVQRKNKSFGQGAEKRFSVPLEAMTGQDVTVTTDSKLHFVDLAGSERLKNTGAQGDRAKEGISINAGLAALGKVISQLSSRNPGSHVSYRDSRLTRLLQDSLGGNAITYMIACVTPAEFHLSETLNTVQYAQRARAIQSKPRIQQIEEGDKQSVIDRLKAEVAFLREQIRSAEHSGNSPRRNVQGITDRSDRQNERETELQNQLLDTQESYTALSQRHARLIAELARARENESVDPHEDSGDTADDRLNRSNSFAQAVEQVVMEYEKTIQSLEQSLSSTRSTLSNTEANLLEKETKCAYVETINTQLQSRLQKLMDRENNTESYLHDLEAKLDGHTNGEEKNATIIMELRKEISRVRENEASCEDYISTLEERLAEADQDAELMQREIDRLEQVIERQRSLGKLDSLLYELDQIQDGKEPGTENGAENAEQTNGVASRRAMAEHSRNLSHVSRHSQMEDPIPEGDEEDHPHTKIGPVKEVDEDALRLEKPTEEGPPPSPAQSKFVADKLETVTQELIDLRVEHESTLHDYDSLHAKYEEAMRKIAEMQDVVDEARHVNPKRESIISVATPTHTRPESFLSDSRTNDLKAGPRSSFTRSLSSELSSAMDSPATAASSNGDILSDDETATTKPAAASTENLPHEDNVELAAELQRLKSMAQEREAAEKELAERYAQLEFKHNETLDIVEELKTDLSRARIAEATSPRSSTPVIRRKSSQNLLVVDRAQRSFSSLRNIASEHFGSEPEAMQSFELNLNAAIHELHVRSERIQELEADVAAAKKEMETKMTIISGLTRERSSLKASPVEMSMVATLRDQLEQNERQLSDTRNAHMAREQALTTELESLRQALAAKSSLQEPDNADSKHEQRVAELQAELATWEQKHQEALNSMATTETQMRGTIEELEARVVANHAQISASRSQNGDKNESATDAEQRQQNLISFLRNEIDEYKAIINSNATKVAELEQAHAAARAELDELHKTHDAVREENARQLELVTKLQEQIAAHDDTKITETTLEELKAEHAKALADLKTTEQKGYEEQVEVLLSEHAESAHRLETELAEVRDELNKAASHVAMALGLDADAEKLVERIDELAASKKALDEEQAKRTEIESHVNELTSINEKIMKDLEDAKIALGEMLDGGAGSGPLVEQIKIAKKRMTDLDDRSKKNSRLVEELEEQLQNNFDEVQITNNRLSTLQTERNTQLDEANATSARLTAELQVLKEDYAALQAKMDEVAAGVQRSNSNSTIRK
ncbi:kinesin, partial [Fusarium beomiforme]